MSTAARVLHANLDLLDRQLLDRENMPCGNVDDVELTVDDDGTAWVTALLTGPGMLMYRMRRRRLGRWLQEADRRLHGDAGDLTDRSRIPMELAYSIGPAIRVAREAGDIASHDLEVWARDQFIDKIPGGRDAPE